MGDKGGRGVGDQAFKPLAKSPALSPSANSDLTVPLFT